MTDNEIKILETQSSGERLASAVAGLEHQDVNAETGLPEIGPLSETLLEQFAPCGTVTLEDLLWATGRSEEDWFFKSALLERFLRRPYHMTFVQGPLDLPKLVQDYRTNVYRSEIHLLADTRPKIGSLLLCLGEGIVAYITQMRALVYAPTPQASAKAAREIRQYVTPEPKEQPGFHVVCITEGHPHAKKVELGQCATMAGEELALHYGDDFVEWERTWIERLSRRRSGVSILFGPPGCG